MRKIIALLIFAVLLTTTPSYGQTGLTLDNGETDVTIKWGTNVTILWDCPVNPALVYFRIRRAPVISGTYSVWVTVPPDQRSYTFKHTAEYHYFITAWYNVPNAGGQIVLQESAGSNHLRIKVK